MDEPLRRFLTDDVLQDVYNYFIGSQQEEGDDEAILSMRVLKVRGSCRHILRKVHVVNYFIFGLHPSIRDFME